jgi:hypothetical protein
VKTRPASAAGTQQSNGAKTPCRPTSSCTALATIFTPRKLNLGQPRKESRGLLPFCIYILSGVKKSAERPIKYHPKLPAIVSRSVKPKPFIAGGNAARFAASSQD